MDPSCNQYKYNMPNIRPIRSPSPKLVPGIDNENSPLQIACTQESSDSIDVVWDWNSPQGKKPTRKCQKRLLPSSKIPLKKHPSMQDFEKLRKELQSLNELALPDRQENVSPLDKSSCNTLTGILLDASIQEFNDEEFDELMDDDINEKLFAISQEIGEQVETSERNKLNKNDLGTNTNSNSALKASDKKENIKDNTTESMNTNRSPVSHNKLQFKKISLRERTLANDSFDDLLRTVDVDKLTGDSPQKDNVKNDQYLYTSTQQIQTNSGKVEFHRTQSFEIANSISQITKCTQQQIEQKRKEALAKLESKKKLDKHIVYSQQEIEKKRLQALAKVEAKRQQDIIERKRQEALKRLELSRQKKRYYGKKFISNKIKVKMNIYFHIIQFL